MKERSAELAVGWIEAWIRMDLEWLKERLAPDFVHTSPFGRLEGRDFYLEKVWVRIDGGLIKEIQSFYDSALVREVLSPDEQENLGGSY